MEEDVAELNAAKNDEDKDMIISQLKEQLKISVESEKKMEVKLTKSEESKKKMEEDHKAAMIEIRVMKEKEIKLRIENKSLSEFKDLNDSNQITMKPITLTCDNCKLKFSSETQMKHHMLEHVNHKIKCRKCNEEFETEDIFQDHMNFNHRKETNKKYYNCPDCYFQSALKEELDNHISIKHTVRGQVPNLEVEPEKIKCRNCGEMFDNMWRLKNHRRDKHPHLRRPCIYDLEDRCNKSANLCWYKHKETHNQNTQKMVKKTHKCFTCQNDFESMNGLMIHRKQHHIDQCKPCARFAKKECSRGEDCWFIHENTEDFREQQNNLAPP